MAGPANPVIPDKLYFRIGEVAALLGLPTYVLRFWEAEFPQLSPTKSGSGHRLYRRRDVEAALRIKRLLYNEGYTIAGAKTLLRTEVRERQPELPMPMPVPEPKPSATKLNRLRNELEEIAGMLARPLPGTRRVPKAARKGMAGRTERRAEPVQELLSTLHAAGDAKRPERDDESGGAGEMGADGASGGASRG